MSGPREGRRESSRRALLAGLALLALAPLALANVSAAHAEERRVPATKVFPYLDAYLRIPPAGRSRFTLGYQFKAARPDGLWLIDGETRTPLPITPDGRIARLPTAAQIDRAQVLVAGPPKTRYAIALNIEPLLAPPVGPAPDLDAATLTAAVTQAAAAIKAFAGPLRFVLPRPDAVSFPGALGGEVIYADGRHAPLPLDKGVARFAPADHPGARVVRFKAAPGRMVIG